MYFPNYLCLPVCGEACEKEVKRLQKVISFAARLVTSVQRRDHITPALRSFRWSRIDELVEERGCTKVHCAVHDYCAADVIRDMFRCRRDIATRDTRLTHTERVHLPRVRLAATQRCNLRTGRSQHGTDYPETF